LRASLEKQKNEMQKQNNDLSRSLELVELTLQASESKSNAEIERLQ
jgi:hypothetical protein